MKKMGLNEKFESDEEFASSKMDCKIDQMAFIMYTIGVTIFHMVYCIYFLSI